LELALEIRDLAPDERDARLKPFREESERRGIRLLSADQRAQLEQIRLERAGLAALAEPQLADKLQLSVDQRRKIADLLEQRDAALAKASGNSAQTVRADFERRFVDALTPDQRSTWDQLTGAPPGAGETVDLQERGEPTPPAERSTVSGAPALS